MSERIYRDPVTLILSCWAEVDRVITQKRVCTLSGTIVEYRHNMTIDPKMFK